MAEKKDDNTQDDTSQLDTGEKKDTEKEEGKEHEPAEGSKRWKEVYHDAKEAGRQVAEVKDQLAARDQDIELLKTHNQALQTAVDSVVDKVSEGDRPNPTEDPEGYDNYIIEKMERKQKQPAPIPARVANQQVKLPNTAKNEAMENAMAAAKSDYYEVITTVRADIERDRVLYNEVWGSPNPYQAAYKYGTEKAKRAKQDKDDNTDQGHVEGGTTHTEADKLTLDAAEKRMAAKVGITEERYLKQKIIIANNRAREMV